MCSELGSLKFGTSEYTMQNLRRNQCDDEVLEPCVKFSALQLQACTFCTYPTTKESLTQSSHLGLSHLHNLVQHPLTRLGEAESPSLLPVTGALDLEGTQTLPHAPVLQPAPLP